MCFASQELAIDVNEEDSEWLRRVYLTGVSTVYGALNVRRALPKTVNVSRTRWREIYKTTRLLAASACCGCRARNEVRTAAKKECDSTRVSHVFGYYVIFFFLPVFVFYLVFRLFS